MKYQLSWTVYKTVATYCPDYVPDPYTGEYPSTHCLVNHFKEVEEERIKTFETKEEAEYFEKNAPPSCRNFILRELG